MPGWVPQSGSCGRSARPPPPLPGTRISVRMKRLTEGIQEFEKIRILKEEFKKTGNKSAIKKIDQALKMFDELRMDEIQPTDAVNKARLVLNQF